MFECVINITETYLIIRVILSSCQRWRIVKGGEVDNWIIYMEDINKIKMKLMKKVKVLVLMFGGVSALWAESEPTMELFSPDGSHYVSFEVRRTASGTNELCYRVDYRGAPVIETSRAGLDMDNRVWEMSLGVRDLEQPGCWMDNMDVDSVTYHPLHDEIWNPLYGERSVVRDHYRSATMYLSKKDGSDYRLNMEVRAYDEGIAFRYFLPEHPKAIFHKVTADLTEYTFPSFSMAWTEQWAQAKFEYLPISSIKHPVERALTVELPGGKWVALVDADVDDWCLTKFVASEKKANTLVSVMYSPVDVVTYCATPWKVIMAADRPGDLLEHNDIIQNLNPACQIVDAAQGMIFIDKAVALFHFRHSSSPFLQINVTKL